MNHDVVAVARRERVVLAAVVAETSAADGTGMLNLVAEDGARFPFPASQTLVRVASVPSPTAGEEIPAWLARVRAAAARPVDWKALNARVDPGARVGVSDLAVLSLLDCELEGDLSLLAVALASADADPWFRREGGAWAAVEPAEAEARLARVEAGNRAHAEDEALRAWWKLRETTPAPDACRGAIDALADFALRGQRTETERGRVLAAKLDVPEPDQALEALVAGGALPATVNPAPYRAGFADGFKKAATAEAERAAATPVDRTGREDFTAFHAVAVDDVETTEVDDAVGLREGPDGVEVLVHISDVAAAVAVGSAVDKAAAERASSLYAPDGAVPMLPLPLVARTSLEAGVEREAVTGVFRVGDDGRVVAARFVRSVVKVARRVGYEATTDLAALAATPEAGRRLVEIAERLRAARREAGALLLSVESLKVSVKDGAPRLVVRRQDTPGDLVVGELMVLFNREAARVLAAKDAPAFYRTQQPPRDPEPAADDPLFPLRARRRFAPSNVSIEPGRHHGVGADAYLQATSPIRRFADLVNQRQLVAVGAGEKPPYRHADLERMTAHLVERERAVRLAGDDRADYWIARAYEPRVGELVDGVLSRAPRRGMGSVWTPALCRELPVRQSSEWKPPPEGSSGRWRVARVAPWRGRIELAP